jgi:hypothetical protein
MREAFALITIILLFWIGWDQSYQDHFLNIVNKKSTAASNRLAGRREGRISPTMAPAVAAPIRDNSWMWDRSKLDNPHEERIHRVR